ncbi:unnamed protein product [Coregonus sp. 'balchen']|nr:unnamed protein product [Coregonus sp. 'balchen']
MREQSRGIRFLNCFLFIITARQWVSASSDLRSCNESCSETMMVTLSSELLRDHDGDSSCSETMMVPLSSELLRDHDGASTDYYYEYTECDSTGSRWRVAIPHNLGTCSGLPTPTRGTDCLFSCAAGEFLEMSAQQCTPCAAGSYSLGSGVRFDQWDTIPAGFTSLATYMDPGPSGEESQACNSYQYPDNNIFFEFYVQNEQCQEMAQTDDQKWIKLTTNGEWDTHTVNLKSGTNILYWRTTGILVGGKMVKPVLLRNIHIEGVAYTSECFPCRPGWFSSAPGSSSCQPCPRNTSSNKGATSCTPCPDTQYSHEGWSQCKERPPCSEKDYFQIHTACDSEGKTQVMYRWVEPRICEENVTGAVALPPTGEREACPPCNPGFYNTNDSTCFPCPPGTHSDGTSVCEECPAGTEPVLGYEYKWWNVLPSNMKTSCFNVGNSKCDDMNGETETWLGLPTSLAGMTGTEFGRIIFVFETICSADCELYFMMDVNRKSTMVVESWEGSKERQSYTHIMTKNASVSYTWAFQRTNQAQDVSTHTHTHTHTVTLHTHMLHTHTHILHTI